LDRGLVGVGLQAIQITGQLPSLSAVTEIERIADAQLEGELLR